MATSTSRIEIRVSPQVKARIENAAELSETSVSSFMITAAADRADQVVRQHETQTAVPAAFFDAMIASLDEADEVNAALVKAARRSRARAAQF